MSDATGAFTLSGVPVGAYRVTASKAGYAPFTLADVGVAGGLTTMVSLALTVDSAALGTVTGTVTDAKGDPVKGTKANPIAGAVVTLQGQAAKATTDATGAFTLTGVTPGPAFIAVATPDPSKLLPTETRRAVIVPPAGSVDTGALVLSSRPSDAATYVGMNDLTGCLGACHGANNHNTGDKVGALKSAAHNRSLTRIVRDANGRAVAGAWARLLNPTLNISRTVMIPLAGTINVAAGSPTVTGSGTSFSTGTADGGGGCGHPATAGTPCGLVAGDVIGYTPTGLGWTPIGTVAAVASDATLTLTANATLAPGKTTESNVAYSVLRLSRTGLNKQWPVDNNDIVAPSWPGVKVTNPNYDADDPCIYGPAPMGKTCAATGGASQYPDGQVMIYLCNLNGSNGYTNDDYVMKFGGKPYTCSDGSFYDANKNPNPPVPMVHMDMIYGGQGDKTDNGPHINVGVAKQRYLGRLDDIKAASSWSYTNPPPGMLGGRAYDGLILPFQVQEAGDRDKNGGFKTAGYHPTENKFPGESWTQRFRTFSHSCAGCHTTGLQLGFQSITDSNLPFGRDCENGVCMPADKTMSYSAVITYNFLDENLTCEHCHGPGSEHVVGGGRGNAIINPKYLTAEAERQVCGKCHAFDDGGRQKPFEASTDAAPWNSDYASKLGGGNFVPGVYDLFADAMGNGGFLGHYDERLTDDEAFWDPAKTGGILYGQQHRQQYTMFSYAVMANNPYEKMTCTSCHNAHSGQIADGVNRQGASGVTYDMPSMQYRDNVLCLSCHAEVPGSFSKVTMADVAGVHVGDGGAAIAAGKAYSPSSDDIATARNNVAAAVAAHMLDKAKMGNVVYNPLDDNLPTGRCTACHMPKIAKSGGYTTGRDYLGNETIIEGDQASHTFNIIWPWMSQALSRSGPSFQSGNYGYFQAVATGNVAPTKYQKYGYMPNSCSKCHPGARMASVFLPDSSDPWPAYWPLNDHLNDGTIPTWYTSLTAP